MSIKRVTRRIQVVFTQEQYEMLQKLKGEMGSSDSEVVRSIVLNWLTEKSFISTTVKLKLNEGRE